MSKITKHELFLILNNRCTFNKLSELNGAFFDSKLKIIDDILKHDKKEIERVLWDVKKWKFEIIEED